MNLNWTSGALQPRRASANPAKHNSDQPIRCAQHNEDTRRRRTEGAALLSIEQPVDSLIVLLCMSGLAGARRSCSVPLVLATVVDFKCYFVDMLFKLLIIIQYRRNMSELNN